MYGTFNFVSDADNIVGFVFPGSAAQRAGIKLGDRVDYARMPLKDHYQERQPVIGRSVRFLMARGNKKFAVTLSAEYHRERWIWSLGSQLAKKIASLVLIIVGSTLLLLRPTRLSRAFFLYAIGGTLSPPYFFSFLPMAAYFIFMAAFDALFTAHSYAYLWLALNFGSKQPRRWASCAPIVGFGATFLLLLTADATIMLVGKPAATLYNVAQIPLICGYLAGVPSLIETALTRSVQRSERFAAAWLAAAGAAMLLNTAVAYVPFDWANSTFAARILVKNLAEITLIMNLLASLIFAYVIIRARIVDTGLVVSRIFWYGVLVFAVVALLAAVNWAYASQLAAFAFVIPLEVVAAVAIGYAFSGFRDVANALSLATVDAEREAVEGHAGDERTALQRALGLSERTRQAGLIAEIRACCAFSAWFWGDDEEFTRQINALRRALGTKVMRGLHTFAYANAANADDVLPSPGELAEWRARAALIACGETDDAALAQRLAGDALAAADESGLPFLRIIALVARAELVAHERDNLLQTAYRLAEAHGWTAVCKSLHALRADARDIGMLQAFVDVRLLKVRPATPALEVSFFVGEVRAFGTRVDLPDKELELLLSVAASRTPVNGEELIDSLWPDADGDLAHTTLRVCLHRLRRHLGDPGAIRRIRQAYLLHAGAAVDLWKLQDALAACERTKAPDAFDELGRLYAALRDGSGRRAMLGTWFAPFDRMLAHRQADAEKLLAMRSHDELTARRGHIVT
jgi:hypothetical protein